MRRTQHLPARSSQSQGAGGGWVEDTMFVLVEIQMKMVQMETPALAELTAF